MKKLMLMTALLTLALTGCVQVEMVSEIDKNGGGTYSFSYSMSTEVEEALMELQALDPDSSEMPEFFDMDEDAFKEELKGTGNKLAEYRNEVVDGRRVMSVTIEFEDVNALSGSVGGLMGDEGAELGGFGVVRHGDDYLLKTMDLPADYEEEDEEEEMDMESMEDMSKAMENAQKTMALMGKLMAHANELSASCLLYTSPSPRDPE